MQTDIPLKELTVACAPDLLPLLGAEGATVLEVESLELPTTATRLDTLLRLRSPRGTPYLHLIEWQGYHDPDFLKRTLYYRAWLMLRRPEPVMVTLIYMKREDDVGDTLRQMVDDQEIFLTPFHCVRLWELDAEEAITGGRPGLAVLSPFMRGGNAALIEQAAAVVLRNVPDPAQQRTLISILGVFAEQFADPLQLEKLLGRDQLMESKLLDYLVGEKLKEQEQRFAEIERRAIEREKQLAEREQRHLHHAIGTAISSRFPMLPFAVGQKVMMIADPDLLLQLLDTLLLAPDQAAAEEAIRQAAGVPTPE